MESELVRSVLFSRALLVAGIQLAFAQTATPPQGPPPTPTRAADAPGAPHWIVVGASSSGPGTRAGIGMNAPVNRNGDFLIGPEYRPAAELIVTAGVAAGSVQ